MSVGEIYGENPVSLTNLSLSTCQLIMADRPSQVKMAVISEHQDIKDSIAKSDIDHRTNFNNARPGTENFPPKKKGTFKITSVKLNDTNDGDSMDDLDESHTDMTEEYSSEILDTSRATDYGQDTPSAAEDMPSISSQNNIVHVVADNVKEKTGADIHSRFRVVKIETKEPFHRGRWICHDYLDPHPSTSVSTEKSDTKVYAEDTRNDSGSSSAGSSIHYVHGVDDPAKNPLLAGATGTVHTLVQTQIPEGQQVSGTPENFQPIHPASVTAVNPPTSNNTASSVMSSIGYYTDSSQGQGINSMCQTTNRSQSHQSINSLVSADAVHSSSGSTQVGDLKSGSVQQNIPTSENQNVGNVHQQGVYMPHYSVGQPVHPMPGTSLYQNIQAPSHIASDSSTLHPSINKPIPVQDNGQGSTTYQTYVHLPQQIANPGVSQGVHTSESANLIDNKSPNVPVSNSDRSTPRDSVSSASMNPSSSDAFSGVLNKDLNVIQNQDGLSPALAAAVGDLHTPTREEDQRLV